MKKISIQRIQLKPVHMILLAISLMTSACQESNSLNEADLNPHSQNTDHTHSSGEGRKLTEVAGKPTMPSADKLHATAHDVPENAVQYIGRYRVEISCDDPFVECDKGNAEFILNLLPNGSAHRIFVHLGKVTYATSNQYRQDSWLYDQALNEIVLTRGSGVKFYYDVGQDDTLTMNVSKIATAQGANQAYFAAGNALPGKAYKLIKIIED